MIKIKLKNQKNLIKSSYGFSIIELMVVVIIIGLITLGLVALFSGGVRSWISGESQLEAQRNARQAMDSMVRELRHAKSVVISDDEYSIVATIPTLNGSVQYNVTYSWSGTPHDPLNRTKSDGTNVVINDVLNLQFISTKSSRVNILLSIDMDNDFVADITLNTAVNFRNF